MTVRREGGGGRVRERPPVRGEVWYLASLCIACKSKGQTITSGLHNREPYQRDTSQNIVGIFQYCKIFLNERALSKLFLNFKMVGNGRLGCQLSRTWFGYICFVQCAVR